MLPDEILFAIFSDPSLTVNDLLQMRSACKRFNSLIVGLKITKLAMRNIRRGREIDYPFNLQKSENYSSQLFRFINEPIGASITLNIIPNRFPKIATTRQILFGVKQLSIDKLDLADFRSIRKSFLTPLKELKGLESLQIFLLKLGSKGLKKISLPTVRLLSIIQFESHGSKLRVDAPNLSRLSLFNRHTYSGDSRLDRLQLVQPETLEEIEVDCYHEELTNFPNLKTIRFRNETMLITWPVQIFTAFPKLESVYFGLLERNSNLADDVFTMYPFWTNRMNHLIGELLRLGRKQRNLSVKIYLMDFKVENQRDLDELFVGDNPLDVNNTRLVLNNYAKLASVITSIRTIHYADLIDHFDNVIPGDFHQRFVNIRAVSFDRSGANQREIDPRRFVEFIEKCEVLNVLELKHVNLDGRFFANLHVSCPFLSILHIVLESQAETPDTSFILNHKHLNDFSINRPMPYSVIERAFIDLQSFRGLKYEMNGKPIEIDRNWNSLGSLKISNKNLNSPRVPEFLEGLKNLFDLVEGDLTEGDRP